MSLTTQPPVTPSRPSADECFRMLFESQTLSKAPAMRSLLHYLWTHRGEGLSEYAVGIDALGRKSDFDPKTDATVRVQIARLRQKLKEFYENEAPEADTRLTIPLGGHELEVVRVNATPESVPARWPVRKLVLPGLAMALLLAVGGLLWENSQLREALNYASQAPPPKPRFWASFLSGGRPTDLVLPSPVFFIWDERRLVIRDSTVNDFSQQAESAYLPFFVERYGPPRLTQHYSVMADTVAGLKLAQFLERHGEHLWVRSASELSVDSFGERNIIFVGTPGTSDHVQTLLADANFYINPGQSGVVHNRRPAANEPARFEEAEISPQRSVIPGVITLVPGKGGGTKVLVLSSRYPASLVSFLIAPNSIEILDRLWKSNGQPEFFEAVVLGYVEGNTVLKTKTAAFRAVSLSH